MSSRIPCWADPGNSLNARSDIGARYHGRFADRELVQTRRRRNEPQLHELDQMLKPFVTQKG